MDGFRGPSGAHFVLCSSHLVLGPKYQILRKFERLEALMPNTFGITWAAALASPSAAVHHACTYARQFESVAARWQSGDHSMLQPVVAYPLMALTMIGLEVRKEAGRKELELLGQSSGARAAAGGSDVFQRGAQAT
jgi:hypothetical protein